MKKIAFVLFLTSLTTLVIAQSSDVTSCLVLRTETHGFQSFELRSSYMDDTGMKTLRSYTNPADLKVTIKQDGTLLRYSLYETNGITTEMLYSWILDPESNKFAVNLGFCRSFKVCFGDDCNEVAPKYDRVGSPFFEGNLQYKDSYLRYRIFGKNSTFPKRDGENRILITEGYPGNWEEAKVYNPPFKDGVGFILVPGQNGYQRMRIEIEK